MKDFLLGTLLAFICAFLLFACEKKEEAKAPPPPDVKVAVVLQKTVPIYVENVGETVGAADIEIRARVEGFLESVNFQEGTFVKKGQLLYTIDPQPLRAALAQARGQTAEAQAQLAKADQDVARYKPLVEKNAISREEYDTAVSAQLAAAASVDASKASEKDAELNLGYTNVYSPIDGLVGKTQVKAGNLVGRGENTLLTTVSNIESIHVRSNVSERDYLRLARAKGAVPQSKDKTPDSFELVLADGSLHNYKGRLVYADRAVDPETGTLAIEASFPNPDHVLRPGQYARLRAAIDEKKDAILVPQIAVQELQGTYSVAVVGSDNKVTLRTVQASDRIGSLWVIDSGLNAGEKIVVEGLQKVRDGVTVNPTVVQIQETSAPAPTGSAT
ncbi:efflux RND transporter periplasmic adaptor subunit [bacterium]|nr:efflux RND transporter periplasmic adaptor subunit [bacterium]